MIVFIREFITGSRGSTVKIVQWSGMIVKRAMQRVIKSGPRVIIRTWFQRNGEQTRSVWETSRWPSRMPLIPNVKASSGASWQAVSLRCWWADYKFSHKTLKEITQLFEYIFLLFFFFLFSHLFGDAVMSWPGEGLMFSFKEQEATGWDVSLAHRIHKNIECDGDFTICDLIKYKI